MSRKGENIYKRKDGRWEGRYAKGYLNGKIKYGYIYGKTYKEVKEKILNHIRSDSYTEQLDDIKYLYFREIGEKWLKNLKPQLKQSSIVKYSNILKIYLFPKFGEISINCITCNDIMNYGSELLDSGGTKGTGLSPRTVSSILSVLKSIFVYTSRFENIVIPDFSCISIKQNTKPMRIFRISEQNILTKYLYENKSLRNLGILVCMYTGIRIGEVCALKWKNISLTEHCITVENTMQRIQTENTECRKTKVIISSPKSNSSIRIIPIPENLYSVLAEYISFDDAYLLTGDKNKFLEPRTLQNHFKSVIKSCNLKDANFHALRHTFATRCIEIGFDVKSLSEILGHASVNITLNRYVHPSMELKQRNMNMMSDLFAVK